jgi:hypothetical protein
MGCKRIATRPASYARIVIAPIGRASNRTSTEATHLTVYPVPAWHNITNIGDEPMQVYTVYAPQHHTPGKVHQTKGIADADTNDQPADWSNQPGAVADQHA